MNKGYRSFMKAARISPRKVRLVVDMIRGKTVQDALDQLRYTNKRSAPVIYKMINSAVSNAKAAATVDLDRMIVSKVCVDDGPTFKRFLPRAQGRATPIRKRTSHITLEVSEV